MDIGTFASYFRLPARVYVAIALVSGFLLIGPDTLLVSIGLASIVDERRGWIAIVTLVPIALALAELVAAGWKVYRAPRLRALEDEARDRETRRQAQKEKDDADRYQEKLIEQLSRLTSDEKAMLLPFVHLDVRSRKVPMNSATLKALCAGNILRQPAQMIDYHYTKGYQAEVFIQPWAMEHLKKHPELLQ